jgi:hypothetical protein
MGRDVHSEGTMTLVQAAQACGLTFERFRRLAVALEMVPKDWGQGTPLRLERANIAVLAERLQGNKDLTTIARELGMADPATARLARDGRIDYIVAGGFNQRDLNKWILHRDAATGLLRQLDAHIPLELDQGSHLAGLPQAAQLAHSSASKLVELVLAGSLRIRGIDDTATGLWRYLISKSDTQITLRRERAPGLSLEEAMERIGLTSSSVHSFVKGGLIASKFYGRVRTVTEAEVERFKREYATVPQVSEISGLRWGEVKKLLTEAGVAPVAERPKFDQILYDREPALRVLSRA